LLERERFTKAASGPQAQQGQASLQPEEPTVRAGEVKVNTALPISELRMLRQLRAWLPILCHAREDF